MTNLITLLLVVVAATSFPFYVAADEGRTIELRVSSRDTLIELCAKHLETPQQWKKIAELNHLSNPNRLLPGQRLLFPVEMLRGVSLKGTVTSLHGSASIKTADDTTWRPLHAHDIITVGSSLKTDKKSAVEITFEDGTECLLREETLVNVKTAKRGLLHLLRVIYLESGKVISRVKSATGRDSRFEIKTPSALAAARGTEYRVSYDGDGATRAEMLQRSIAVSSMGKTVVLNQGEGLIATRNEPPSPPQKLPSPPKTLAPSACYSDNPLEIRFSTIKKPSSYRVLIARDREGRQVVKEEVIRPEDAFRMETIEAGTYYVITSSIDAQGLEGPLSAPHEIVVRTARRSDSPPTIVSPASNTTHPDMPITVEWRNVEGQVKYHLQIAGDREFSHLITDEDNLSETSYRTKRLHAGNYAARLRSMAADGSHGAWSDVRQFSVVRLTAPVLKKPDHSATTLTITWDAAGEGLRYQIQVSPDEDFEDFLVNKTLAQSELSLEKPTEPGIYYMRIRALDSKNGVSSFSAASSFDIAKPEKSLYELLGIAGLMLLIAL